MEQGAGPHGGGRRPVGFFLFAGANAGRGARVAAGGVIRPTWKRPGRGAGRGALSGVAGATYTYRTGHIVNQWVVAPYASAPRALV
ncbi:hypothetical protein HOK021_13710 [Streptomyces hygroscopicus]|nr:hypothetical protein HOK021_13710 [Streptomyces hygroscopicus]